MKKFSFKINGNDYIVEIKDLDGNIASIEVNGTPYDVEIDKQFKVSKTPKLVRPPVERKSGEEQIAKKPSGAVTAVAAPLPGTIMEISVAIGDSVKRGDRLMVMEAMKMENNIQAEKDGIVKSVKVAVGDNVLQGDILVELA
ncbi:MAG: biotin/lipoyl-containing protein [Bacteroidales bacterium]|nr:biotin/lipoyl-containing protein [Bacteroidales bacterium]